MRRVSKIFTLALALALCMGLAACGGQTSSDSDLAYIKGNGKIIIGYTDFAPMNYVDDSGAFTGFDTEFAQAVCAKLGVEPDFILINWDTKETELAAKSIDCIWNGMTINPGRLAEMSISVPYVLNAQVVVVKADSGYSSTADLVGKTVVAEAGSAGEVQILGDAEHDVEPDTNLSQTNYVLLTKQTDCLLEVMSGTADACVLDWTLAKTMVGAGTDFADLMMIPDLFLGEEEYGIAFRKGSDVTAAVNGYIAELVADGTLPALAEKYDLSLSPKITG